MNNRERKAAEALGLAAAASEEDSKLAILLFKRVAAGQGVPVAMSCGALARQFGLPGWERVANALRALREEGLLRIATPAVPQVAPAEYTVNSKGIALSLRIDELEALRALSQFAALEQLAHQAYNRFERGKMGLASLLDYLPASSTMLADPQLPVACGAALRELLAVADTTSEREMLAFVLRRVEEAGAGERPWLTLMSKDLRRKRSKKAVCD